MERSVKIERKRKKTRKEGDTVQEKSWPSNWHSDRLSRYSCITTVLFSSCLSPSSFFFSSPLLDSSQKQREAAATAAAETSTLLGCKSCGTGLRELPLEELHSPYVLPRHHVTHIYLCLLQSLRMHRHTYMIKHTHARAHGFTCAVMLCTVCADIRSGRASSSRLGRCSFFSLLAFVNGTGSRYRQRYSIQSIRTLDHLGDRQHRAIERIEWC